MTLLLFFDGGTGIVHDPTYLPSATFSKCCTCAERFPSPCLVSSSNPADFEVKQCWRATVELQRATVREKPLKGLKVKILPARLVFYCFLKKMEQKLNLKKTLKLDLTTSPSVHYLLLSTTERASFLSVFKAFSDISKTAAEEQLK